VRVELGSGLSDPSVRRPASLFPASSRPRRPLRNIGLVARGERARDLCLETVLDISKAVGRLPCCIDLHENPPNLSDRLDADVVLVSRRLGEPVSERHRRAGDAILRSRAPVLFVPWTARTRMTGGRAVIAWDGSPSAVAALCSAAPLLCVTREILIVDVQLEEAGIDVDQAAKFISDLPGDRHLDVAAQWLESPAALMQAALFTRADYFVMGGVGRWSALPEILYGDCDSSFLRTPVPLLLGH